MTLQTINMQDPGCCGTNDNECCVLTDMGCCKHNAGGRLPPVF